MCLILFTKCPGCVRSLAETDVEVVEFCRNKQDAVRRLIESDSAAVVNDIDVFMACDMQEIWGIEEFRHRLTRFHRCSPWNHVAPTYEAIYESLITAATAQLGEADGLPSTELNAGLQSNSLLFEAHPPIPEVRPLYTDRQVMWLHTLVRQHRRERRNATLGPMAAAFLTGRLLIWYHGLTPVGVVNLRNSLLAEPIPTFPQPVAGPPPAFAPLAPLPANSAASAESPMRDEQGAPAAGEARVVAAQDGEQGESADRSGGPAKDPARGNNAGNAGPDDKQNKDKNQPAKVAAPGGKPTKSGPQAGGQGKPAAQRGRPKATPPAGKNPKSAAQGDDSENAAARQITPPGNGPGSNSKKRAAKEDGPANPPAAKPPRRARSRAPAKSAPPPAAANDDAAAAGPSNPSRGKAPAVAGGAAAAKDGKKPRAAPRGKAPRSRGGAAAGAQGAGTKRGRPHSGDGAADEEEDEDEEGERRGSVSTPIDLRSPSVQPPVDLCTP